MSHGVRGGFILDLSRWLVDGHLGKLVAVERTETSRVKALKMN